jgi:predicted AAA+ superfamily ATPase
VLGHPKSGASWEGFVVEQLVRRLGADASECFFWGVHTGAELDLLVVRGRRRMGFEVKLTDSPGVTRSMRAAMEALGLARLDVVHAGSDTFPLAGGIRALSARRLWIDLEPL